MNPRCQQFMDAAVPWLRGEVPATAIRAVGPTPATDADLAFYPWLTRFGHHQTLRELFGGVAALLEAHGGPDWDQLCDAFLRDHPPTGWDLTAMGDPFPDWLVVHLAGATFLERALGGAVSTADALGAIADHLYCRVRSRHAADTPGLCLDERLFVRRYPVDVAAWVRDPHAAAPAVTTTVGVYRDLRDDVVKLFTPTVATLAVIAERLGHPRTGALALSAAALAEETGRLEQLGVLEPG